MGIASRRSTEAIGYCFPILGGLLVVARFASRWRKGARWGIDDWLCIPAWLFVTGACASLLSGLYLGAFFSEEGATDTEFADQLHLLAQILASFVFFWTVANATIKFSILFFYRRMFRGHIFNIASWILIGCTGIWLVYSLLAWLLYCGTDVRANFEGPWDECPFWGVGMEMGVFLSDSVIDLALILLPIPILVQLHTTASKKFWLVGVFLVGGFAFVAGLNNTVIQLIYVVHPDDPKVEDAPADFTQGGNLILTNWPAIEIGVGLIACNLPSISWTSTTFLSTVVQHGWRTLSTIVSWGRSSRNTTFVQPEVRSGDRSSAGRGNSSGEIPLTAVPSDLKVNRFDLEEQKGTGWHGSAVEV